MNAVLGYTQLLQSAPGLGPEQQQHLAVIRRSGDHLLHLINDVLEMSRIEAGRDDEGPRPPHGVVDLGRLVADLDDTFRRPAEDKQLAFAIEQSPDVPPHLAGDEDRLRQALANLIGNAVKFTREGGVLVRVRVRRGAAGEPTLAVEVEDTGPGIEPGKVGELFRPFAQVRAGIEAQGGTGLGLALSRRFAQLMGGDVTLESRPGAGCVFALQIPLTVVADAPIERTEPSRVQRAEPARTSAPPCSSAVLRQRAAALPDALVRDLSAAVNVADYDVILAVLARFPAEHAPAAEALRALVEQYRYDDIAAALRR